METAINKNKAYNETGSFWNTQLTKKSLEDAKNVCALSLYTTILNSIDNCINNLSNKGKQKVINKTICFDKNSITEIDENIFEIDYSYDINITKIVANMIDGKVVILDTTDFAVIRGTNYKFTNIQFTTINPRNIKDSKFIVDGIIETNSDNYKSLLSSLINISFIPCDKRAKSVADYIGGSKQSPFDFYRALNFISNCFDIGINNATIKNCTINNNASTYKLSNNTADVMIEYPYDSNQKNLSQYTSIDGKGDNRNIIFDANDILNPSIEVQYPGAYNIGALGTATSEAINTTTLEVAYKLGNPILIICYDARLLNKEDIINMHNIVAYIYPIGYTLNQYVKYVSQDHVLSYTSYDTWIS